MTKTDPHRSILGVGVIRTTAALAAASLAGAASAVGGSAAHDGTAALDFIDVFDRLDPTALALIAAALLIAALVVWRVVAMIRRERPAPRPQAGGRSGASGRRGGNTLMRGADSLTRPTLQAQTDWGFDQNKRSAVGRGDSRGGLASIDGETRLPAETMVGQAATAVAASPAQPSPYRTGTNPYYLRSELVEPRIDVTEVADVVTQAELLVQLGDPKEAMNVLSRHIRETEKPGPQVWLMLLDLYRSTGREAQYNALAEGFKALFNAAVPAWPAGPAGGERWLEDYPQVLKKTMAEWPTPACRGYLERLLNDDRGGSRQGFSLAAYRDLLFLVDLLDARAELEAEDEARRGIDRKLNA